MMINDAMIVVAHIHIYLYGIRFCEFRTLFSIFFLPTYSYIHTYNNSIFNIYFLSIYPLTVNLIHPILARVQVTWATCPFSAFSFAMVTDAAAYCTIFTPWIAITRSVAYRYVLVSLQTSRTVSLFTNFGTVARAAITAIQIIIMCILDTTR